jgi:hypothetical protein
LKASAPPARLCRALSFTKRSTPMYPRARVPSWWNSNGCRTTCPTIAPASSVTIATSGASGAASSGLARIWNRKRSGTDTRVGKISALKR